MSFIRTPLGLVMHEDNHRALVERAKGSKGLLAMLEPTEPVAEVTTCDPDVTCPTCQVALVPEHAHHRCPRCGYRSSCCF